MANIKSQLKRIKTNEKARLRNKAVKSSLKTSVRKFREAADAGECGDAEQEADEEQAKAGQAAAEFAQGEGPGKLHRCVIPAHAGISAGETCGIRTR